MTLDFSVKSHGRRTSLQKSMVSFMYLCACKFILFNLSLLVYYSLPLLFRVQGGQVMCLVCAAFIHNYVAACVYLSANFPDYKTYLLTIRINIFDYVNELNKKFTDQHVTIPINHNYHYQHH